MAGARTTKLTGGSRPCEPSRLLAVAELGLVGFRADPGIDAAVWLLLVVSEVGRPDHPRREEPMRTYKKPTAKKVDLGTVLALVC